MSIVSTKFILFLIALLFVYYATNRTYPKAQWVVLLIASVVFYSFVSLQFLVCLLIATFVTWILSLFIEEKTHKKLFLILAIVCDAGMLCAVKYTSLLMPLGVSFYTFQSLGYCIDVYKGKTEAEKNPLKYLLFVMFFPQISQGPIGRYDELAPQLFRSRKFDYVNFRDGLERALVGYFKKVFIANNISIIVNTVYSETDKYSSLIFLPIIILYALQLYADFSGYTDIVLGISKSIGITLRENFETPFLSRSIGEYWRRWHISLSTWLRDYIYFPLGGSRQGKLRKYINTLIVFLISGAWHGSSFSFIVWGLAHGMLINAENIGVIPVKKLEKTRIGAVINWIYSFLIVSFLYVFFRAQSFNEAIGIFAKFLRNPMYSGWSGGLFYYTEKSYWIVLAIALACIVIIDIIEKSKRMNLWLNERPTLIRWLILDAMLFAVLYSTVFSNIPALSVSDFLYFNF